MERLYNKIFNQNGSLSKEQMQAYLRDELSEKDRNAVEQVLEHSAFDAEALEGFEAFPDAITGLDKLSNPYQNTSFKTSDSSSSASKWILWGSIAAGVAMIMSISYFSKSKNSEQFQVAVVKQQPSQHKSNEIVKKPISEAQSVDLPDNKVIEEKKAFKSKVTEMAELNQRSVEKKVDHIEILEQPFVDDKSISNAASPPPNIEEANKARVIPSARAPQTESMSNSNVNNDFSATANTEDLNIEYSAEEDEIESVSSEMPIEMAAPIMQEVAEPERELAKPRLPEKTMEDFLIVDYDNIYSSLQTSKKELAHTEKQVEAKFEDEEAKSRISSIELNQNKEIFIQYDDVLRKGLVALKKEQFETAITQFNLILRTYPKDQNASFYKGYALYNMAEYASALPLFKVNYFAINETFKESAQWYIGLTYEESAQQEEAKKIFEQIVEQKGFYSNKAQHKLLEIKGN